MTDFLRDVLRDHIHLVSIVPDTEDIRGRHFEADHVAAWAWARSENERGAGVYFTVNKVRPGVHKKSTKDDIVGVRFAHSDIDPPKDGSPWDKDAVLIDILTKGEPSYVIDSGNGWQPLWTLSDQPEDVENINRGIDAVFTSDKCHNIDRILRLPDTINYPNAKKRAVGRVAVPTSLAYESGEVYSSAAVAQRFPFVPPPPSKKVTIDLGEWQPETPESLGLSAQMTELVEREVGRGDRSEHAYNIAAEMIKLNFTNEQIVGLLMNNLWSWSGTIHDQGDPLRQATRKIESALSAGVVRPAMAFDTPAVAPGVEVLPEPPRVTKMREDGLEQRNGKMMFVDEQLEHFKGCTYIEELDAVLCPDWVIRKQPQFNKHYGGHRFIFSPDGVSGSQLTKSAWEAFTENAAFRAPTVQRTCFRPEHEPRAIVHGSGVRMINTWRGLSSVSKEGDASPFINHVRKLLPVGDDADMLLSYMAYCVQNPGKKVQWWPVIQGCPGNGKSMLLSIIRYCLGEEHYHEPDTAKMVRNGIDFNAWVVGCLFVGMEEVYASNRREFLEGFKRYVTNYSLTIRPMYGAEYTGDNRANGMVLTNHRDGVPIDDVERRYAPMFTAQQSRADMIRDGMGGSYFPDLWTWLRADGYAIVNHFLKTHAVNNEWVLSAVAPVTSSTREAVSASLGRAEQEIMESIEQGEPGFAGGWVSSIMLDRLLDAKRVVVPRNKRKEMMEKLGYEVHPGLTNGRCSSVVMPDGGKPRLYVTIGHLSLNATKPSEVERLYTEAQSRAAANVAQSRLGA